MTYDVVMKLLGPATALLLFGPGCAQTAEPPATTTTSKAAKTDQAAAAKPEHTSATTPDEKPAPKAAADAAPTPPKSKSAVTGISRLKAATVTASSKRRGKGAAYAPWRAFDEIAGGTEDRLTGWCEGAKGSGKGESLTLTFAEPVDVGQITVELATPMDRLRFAPIGNTSALEIRIDGSEAPLAIDKDSDDNLVANASSRPTSSITFTLKNEDDDDHTCILDVRFANTTVIVVDKLAPLPPDLERLTAETSTAFETCNLKALSNIRYPFEVTSSDASDGVGMTNNAGQIVRSGAAVHRYRNLGKLTKECRELFANKETPTTLTSAKVFTPHPGPTPGSVLVYAGTRQPEDDMDYWLLWHFELRGKAWFLKGVLFLGDYGTHVPG